MASHSSTTSSLAMVFPWPTWVVSIVCMEMLDTSIMGWMVSCRIELAILSVANGLLIARYLRGTTVSVIGYYKEIGNALYMYILMVMKEDQQEEIHGYDNMI